MFKDLKIFALAASLIAAQWVAPLNAAPMPRASESEAWALVEIDTPLRGQLRQLAGMVGHGTVTLHPADGSACKSINVRFAAGGFWGQQPVSTSESRNGPIKLLIDEPRAFKLLSRGRDVVSDEDFPADLTGYTVISGFPHQTGFVISPKRGPLGYFFGARQKRVTCPQLPQGLAAAR